MNAKNEIEAVDFEKLAASAAPSDLGEFTAAEQQAAIFALLHAFQIDDKTSLTFVVYALFVLPYAMTAELVWKHLPNFENRNLWRHEQQYIPRIVALYGILERFLNEPRH